MIDPSLLNAMFPTQGGIQIGANGDAYANGVNYGPAPTSQNVSNMVSAGGLGSSGQGTMGNGLPATAYTANGQAGTFTGYTDGGTPQYMTSPGNYFSPLLFGNTSQSQVLGGTSESPPLQFFPSVSQPGYIPSVNYSPVSENPQYQYQGGNQQIVNIPQQAASIPSVIPPTITAPAINAIPFGHAQASPESPFNPVVTSGGPIQFNRAPGAPSNAPQMLLPPNRAPQGLPPQDIPAGGGGASGPGITPGAGLTPAQNGGAPGQAPSSPMLAGGVSMNGGGGGVGPMGAPYFAANPALPGGRSPQQVLASALGSPGSSSFQPQSQAGQMDPAGGAQPQGQPTQAPGGAPMSTPEHPDDDDADALAAAVLNNVKKILGKDPEAKTQTILGNYAENLKNNIDGKKNTHQGVLNLFAERLAQGKSDLDKLRTEYYDMVRRPLDLSLEMRTNAQLAAAAAGRAQTHGIVNKLVGAVEALQQPGILRHALNAGNADMATAAALPAAREQEQAEAKAENELLKTTIDAVGKQLDAAEKSQDNNLKEYANAAYDYDNAVHQAYQDANANLVTQVNAQNAVSEQERKAVLAGLQNMKEYRYQKAESDLDKYRTAKQKSADNIAAWKNEIAKANVANRERNTDIKASAEQRQQGAEQRRQYSAFAKAQYEKEMSNYRGIEIAEKAAEAKYNLYQKERQIRVQAELGRNNKDSAAAFLNSNPQNVPESSFPALNQPPPPQEGIPYQPVEQVSNRHTFEHDVLPYLNQNAI